jgi:hypothetical protein
MIEQFQCNKCSEWMEQAAFCRDPTYTSGYARTCKACRRVRARAASAAKRPSPDDVMDLRDAQYRELARELVGVLNKWPAIEPANNLFWRIRA